jgi:hypothetical protein
VLLNDTCLLREGLGAKRKAPASGPTVWEREVTSAGGFVTLALLGLAPAELAPLLLAYSVARFVVVAKPGAFRPTETTDPQAVVGLPLTRLVRSASQGCADLNTERVGLR